MASRAFYEVGKFKEIFKKGLTNVFVHGIIGKERGKGVWGLGVRIGK